METNDFLQSGLQTKAFILWAYNFYPSDIEKLKKDIPLFSYVWDNKIVPESSAFGFVPSYIVIDNLTHRLGVESLAMVYAYAWERYATEVTERHGSFMSTKQVG